MTEARARSPEAARLLAAAGELAAMAVEIRETSRTVAAAGAAPGLPAAARYRLLRAATSPRGLGIALPGRLLGRATARATGMVGAESLAVRLLVASLRLRIAAVTRDTPDLAGDPAIARLLDAVAADRRLAAARLLRTLLRERGTMGTLSAIAPIFSELLALNALLDANPLNDHTAWLIATGTGTASADPITGISNMAIAVLDRSLGTVRPATLTPDEAGRLGTRGSLLDFLRNIGVIGTTGRVLVQSVRGPDGVTRHVVQVPGMRPGEVDNDSPQDLLGAFSSTLIADSPYARALLRAVESYGIDEGDDIALVGHSAGGAAVMNLTRDPAFSARYRLTHAVVVGAPVDFKAPADPRTWVASITDQHDLIPSLDGQGAGTCFDLHPDWYVVDYPCPGGAQFPESHTIEHYIDDIATRLPEYRAHIDEHLTPYRGDVTRTEVYRVHDHAPPPDGFPFLTVPTRRFPYAGGHLDLPLRTPDARAFVAYFAVDAAAARPLLDGTGLAPVRLGRHCVVQLHALAHTGTGLGPHRQIGAGIVVHDPWGPRWIRAWTDLLRPVGRRRTGCHLTAVAVDSPGGPGANRELWGHPAHLADLDVTVTRRTVRLRASDTDGHLLGLSGPLGPALPVPAHDLLTYTQPEGPAAALLSSTELRGHGRLHPAPRVRLDVGRHPQPLPDHLRALGLDGARPVLCLTAPACGLRSDAATPVQII